jgi:CIC family chloride channel protein
MFRIPPVELRDPRELIAYAVLGVVGGIAALVFSRALAFLRPRLRSMPAGVQLFHPAAAGLLVGLIGFFGVPQVMGPGYEVIDQAMHGQFTWQFLLLLGILKILATTLSFSSGTPGGMFAPTLFIGAMLGASVGAFEKLIFPHLSASIGSYALVGMGVLFAGFLRAPLTSVFMVLEVSGNYSIVVPVILANTISYLLGRALQPTPIFELLTHEDGLDLPSMEEQREELSLRIEDAIKPINIPLLKSSSTLAETAAAMDTYAADTALIQFGDRTYYAVRAEELKAALDLHASSEVLESVLPRERLPVLFPDQPLDRTLAYFHRWPVLVVKNRANRNALNGIVHMKEVLERYQEE